MLNYLNENKLMK